MVDLIVCTTCGDATPRQGLTFYEQLSESAPDSVSVYGFKCLMSCKRSCAVQLRADGKFAYTLGDMVPDESNVEGVLTFARHYGQSPDGKVAYADWPDAIRGHFVSRMPPQDQYKQE